LEDIKKGPLGSIRTLLLRNANASDRKPPTGRYSERVHGSVTDLPPMFGLPTRPALEPNSANLRGVDGDPQSRGQKMPRGEYYTPTEERGVSELEQTMPHRLRPSDAMRRYTLFTMPPPPRQQHRQQQRRNDSGSFTSKAPYRAERTH